MLRGWEGLTAPSPVWGEHGHVNEVNCLKLMFQLSADAQQVLHQGITLSSVAR
jgi:hypothetical protein